ncbi:hypothetical protein C0J52_11496 [Blattella germanica]|nr:hypothetical protein C0J52_11496 [Blattella germanica]
MMRCGYYDNATRIASFSAACLFPPCLALVHTMLYNQSHPRWGASLKVTVAVIVGYFLGKVSYQSKCAEMIMALPNSPLAEMLRQRKRKGGFQETITMDPNLSLPPFGDVESYSDVGPHHEIDTDRPYHEGLDDSQRPTLD